MPAITPETHSIVGNFTGQFSPTGSTPCHTPHQHWPPQRQDPPMPPTPSRTYERLRDTIAKRKSHVYQPLMLMELLGHGFARQQPARPPRRT
jgi:hypothetical protein